jgi:alginate O-acetyltransferase complex protein AlgJ
VTTGRDDVHGAEIPSPKWWRPIKYVPLVTLAVLSLLAALIGWGVAIHLNQVASAPAAVAPSPGQTAPSSAVTGACRSPVPAPASEPWIDGDAAAQKVWSANADKVSGSVVLGRDGWAFYNDQIEQNFSQSIGRKFLTVGQVKAWHDYFSSVAKALKKQGIDFTIEITPSAASVYPQELPSWTDDIRGSTPLDQFLAASPDLPIVDFRGDLISASQTNAVYTPVNSHWTDWGGYIGWQTYAACNKALYPDADPIWVPKVSGVTDTGIFNEYGSFGVKDATPEWTAPDFAEPMAQVQVTDNSGATTTVAGGAPLDLSKLPASTKTAGAHTTQTALILRDSMGNALSTYWEQQFSQTWQIQHRYDDWSSPPNFKSLVAQYKPDVVIVQMAERHLINAPTTQTTGY